MGEPGRAVPLREHLAVLAELCPVALFELDDRLTLVCGNEAFHAFAATAGDGWVTLVHPDDRAWVCETIRAHLGALAPFEVECRRSGDGASWLGLSGRPVVGSGTAAGAVCAVRDISSRKAAQGAVAKGGGLFKKVVESVADGILVADLDGRILVSNPAIERMLEYGPGELAGMMIPQICAGSPRPPEDQRWRTGATEHIDYLYRAKSGREVQCVVGLTPYYDENGVIVGSMSVSTDVSAERALQRELEAREARYRAILDNLQDVYFEIDTEDRISYASASCTAQMGYTPDEIVGTPLGEVVVEAAMIARVGELLQVTERLPDVELNVRHRDGRSIPAIVTVAIMRDEGGQFAGYRGTLHNIQERKRLEEERDRIFRLSLDPLAALDRSARLVRANPAWTATTGWNHHELVGKRPFDFFHPDDQHAARAAREQIVAGQDVRDCRLRFRCKDESYRWLSWNITPPGEDGEVYCVVRDISDLVDAEERQRSALAQVSATAARLERQAAELTRLRNEAEYAADHDTLTGLLNRRAWFREAVQQRFDWVCLIDIDRFKAVNDTYGHVAGDAVLRVVADAIRRSAPDAPAGRLGGEEFALLMNGAPDRVRTICDDVLQEIARQLTLTLDGQPIAVTASAGLAAWTGGLQSREHGLARTYDAADRALYQAKAAGRARLAVADRGGLPAAA
jgi:diguanylate cyclase (GGDEF)-like protein/PAS domain S-box-containing protein